MKNNNTKNIENAYRSNKDYIESEFLNMKDKNNKEVLAKHCLRIIDNIELHHDNEKGIKEMFEFMEYREVNRAYYQDLADEVEDMLLDWLENRKAKMLGTE